MTLIARRTFLRSSLATTALLGSQRPVVANATQEAATAFPPIEPDTAGIDPEKLAGVVQFIDAEIAAGTIPGAALVATRGGRTFISHIAGAYRDALIGDQPFHPGVACPLFSFSKGIAGTIAAMLRQEGKIDYDAPVSQYIPAYQGGGKDATTVRHLVTHAAGVPAESHGPVESEEQWQDYVKQLCAATAAWPPGSRTAYHGLSGMFLLAEVVRSVSGRKLWADICQERLFKPIGANGFTFSPDPSASPVAVTPGYFESIEAGKNGIAGHPAGGLFGRPEDMLRLLNMINQNGAWKGKTLLQPDARKEMLTVQFSDEIAKDVAEGKNPAHEPWGIGWLVRGAAPTCPAGPWFGFGDGASPTLYGHAGVDTVFGVGDPARDLAFVFIMTAKLKDAAESTRLRREVSNRLQAAVI